MASKLPSSDRANARRQDMERRILVAVQTLMDDGTPYTELPVQRIAEAAQVPRSTFYLHFPDKSQLLLAISRDVLSELGENARSLWEATPPPTKEQVEAGLLRSIELYREHRHLISALREVGAYDREVSHSWTLLGLGIVAMVERWLTAEREAGRTEPDIDARLTAQLIVAASDFAAAEVTERRPREAAVALAREFARSIWLIAYGRTA